MSIFLIGLVLFVGMHSIYILLPGARTAAIARIGYNSWRGLYSRISLTGLAVGRPSCSCGTAGRSACRCSEPPHEEVAPPRKTL